MSDNDVLEVGNYVFRRGGVSFALRTTNDKDEPALRVYTTCDAAPMLTGGDIDTFLDWFTDRKLKERIQSAMMELQEKLEYAYRPLSELDI